MAKYRPSHESILLWEALNVTRSKVNVEVHMHYLIQSTTQIKDRQADSTTMPDFNPVAQANCSLRSRTLVSHQHFPCLIALAVLHEKIKPALNKILFCLFL